MQQSLVARWGYAVGDRGFEPTADRTTSSLQIERVTARKSKGQPPRKSKVDAIFALGPELRHESVVTCADYAAKIVRGGFPKATFRDGSRRRQRYLDASLN